MTVEVFGVRHHGPGSARSLRAALDRYAPDCVLIEGPSDAQGALRWVTHPDLTPPVALLVYPSENPRRAVYLPFAEFSPEWQALDWALRRGVEARFVDLGIGVSLALEDAGEDEEAQEATAAARPRDPLALLAQAAGYDDAERWWEHLVEERRGAHEGADTDVFPAILEAVGAVRDGVGVAPDGRAQRREQAREACMRVALRAALKQGFSRIAFVCGAWHAPVVRADFGPQGRCARPAEAARADKSLLTSLPKALKVEVTWIPWTYGRLAFDSGYAAGVDAPGWYDHLWRVSANAKAPCDAVNSAREGGEMRVSERWQVKVARMLRAEGFDASSAQVIDAVRLADALAAMRGRPLPGLAEMREAARAVFCMGSAVPLQLIERRLAVGERLGTVPADVPKTPLQRDFEAVRKELRRLPLSPEPLDKKLDLRRVRERIETDADGQARIAGDYLRDLALSRLLHRLVLLDVPWGSLRHVDGDVKGTFREQWRLQWRPELEVSLIVMGRYGATLHDAATAVVRERADAAPELRDLVRLMRACRAADLAQAGAYVARRLQDEAAVATDCGRLMDALIELVPLLYGDVRQTDATTLAVQVESMLLRVRTGLPPACASLDDSAAEAMHERISQTHRAVITLLDARTRADDRAAWLDALRKVLDVPRLHGLVAGRIARILLEAGAELDAHAERRMALALSPASDPPGAAAWIEGFLRDSGTILVYDDRLWRLIDDWLATLPEPAFTAVLPLLRRTFSTFSVPERRALGERARRGRDIVTRGGDDGGLDVHAVERILPVLGRVLGVLS